MTSAMAKRDDESDHVHSKRVARMDRWAGEIAGPIYGLPLADARQLADYAKEQGVRTRDHIADIVYEAAEALECERTRRMQG